MIKKFLFGLSFISLVTSCASSSVQSDLSEGYRLISKAKVTDKVSNESHNVDILITVQLQKAVRMDVTALLGYGVAEIVLNPQQAQYLQHEDKIFVQGPFKAQTLKPLFGQVVEPKLLWSIAHEVPLKDGRYYGADVKTEIVDQNRKITIESSTFKMVWLFKSKEAVKASYIETFVLVKPDEYKLINIK